MPPFNPGEEDKDEDVLEETLDAAWKEALHDEMQDCLMNQVN